MPDVSVVGNIDPNDVFFADTEDRQIHDGRQSWSKNLVWVFRYLTEYRRVGDYAGWLRMIRGLYLELINGIEKSEQVLIELEFRKVSAYYQYILRDNRISGFESMRMEEKLFDIEKHIRIAGRKIIAPVLESFDEMKNLKLMG